MDVNKMLFDFLQNKHKLQFVFCHAEVKYATIWFMCLEVKALYLLCQLYTHCPFIRCTC